ncbi:MAG: magnesium/cobalt transporter CorA [Cetobacterium sp.]
MKKMKKLGLAPGTLVYTGNREGEPIKIVYYTYDENNIHKKTYSEDVDINLLKPDKEVSWIDVGGIHDVKLIEKIGTLYGIDNLILEDMLNHNQRPKMDERENFLFLVLKMITMNNETKEIIYEQISFILGEDYLLTFQEVSGDVFSKIRERLEQGVGKIRKRKENYLAYSLLDAIVDNYLLILEEFDNEIDALEEKILNDVDSSDMEKITELKKKLAIFKRNVNPIREIAIKISNNEMFQNGIENYLRDLYDHSIVVTENMENLNSRVSGLIDLYNSSIGNAMNEIMKVLTTISTIFIPLSFIAGLYGMNFAHMPELNWRYGYYTTLGIMIAIVLGMVAYFKRKKWW